MFVSQRRLKLVVFSNSCLYFVHFWSVLFFTLCSRGRRQRGGREQLPPLLCRGPCLSPSSLLPPSLKMICFKVFSPPHRFLCYKIYPTNSSFVPQFCAKQTENPILLLFSFRSVRCVEYRSNDNCTFFHQLVVCSHILKTTWPTLPNFLRLSTDVAMVRSSSK